MKLLNLPDKSIKSVVEIVMLKYVKETNSKDLSNNFLIEGIHPKTKWFKFSIPHIYNKTYFSHAKHINVVIHLLYLETFK